MVTGVCLLMMMIVSGPFYGFGEYTYLRGYLNVIVSTNLSLPLHASHPEHQRVKLENLHQLFSHLQRSSYSSADTNLLTIIAKHLHDTYDVIVSKASWLPHGISFYIRSKNSDTFQHFIDHYRDRLILNNVTKLSFINDMARSLNISATAVTANITNESYEIYRQTYLPIQDLGICAADMSTPNQYSSVWNGFLTIFILILPYGLALTGLCIIYCRGPELSGLDVERNYLRRRILFLRTMSHREAWFVRSSNIERFSDFLNRCGPHITLAEVGM
ncbi:uncharacterized protein LOC128244503 [Mya arenaria]|uniref:uncharacterized protein LOC128244503 n=1 Tax=Mya arenaria TaxID=6604 RepID=UPI0022E2BDB4|nr:uncharacterized protein LOC128244503 [Mya arenaria]